jgi:hemerythrin-like domain-containing protein
VRATEVLKEEHRAIERMLAVLKEAADRAAAGERVPATLFRDAVDFIRNFADKCHHGKEEGKLFPRLEERGMPRGGGPLAVMLHEHDAGRQYVGAIEGALSAYEGGDEGASQVIVENSRRYVELLQGHIAKEDGVLFPMADRILSDEDQRELEELFEQVETEQMGPGTHEKYHRMLDQVEKELGLA